MLASVFPVELQEDDRERHCVPCNTHPQVHPLPLHTHIFSLFVITSSTFPPLYSPPCVKAYLHFLDFCSSHFSYNLSSLALNLYSFYFSAVSVCVCVCTPYIIVCPVLAVHSDLLTLPCLELRGHVNTVQMEK